MSWSVCPAWGQRVRDFSPLGQRVQGFGSLGQEYTTYSRARSPLGQWARSGLKSTLFKRSFHRKSQAQIFKHSGCIVRLGLPAQLGGKGYVTFRHNNVGAEPRDAGCRRQGAHFFAFGFEGVTYLGFQGFGPRVCGFWPRVQGLGPKGRGFVAKVRGFGARVRGVGPRS